MALDIVRPISVGSIYPNILLTPQRQSLPFRGETAEDTFQSTSLDRYVSEKAIQKMISQNPKIISILNNTPVNVNMTELNSLMQGHAKDTQNIAKGIINNLPFSLKSKVNEKSVTDAAYLHDIGKALIPVEILNKQDKLTPAETEVMHKHSELGYELLKNTDLNQQTLDLIRNHHQNAKKSGYPFVSKDFRADLNLQIVSLADKFSALTEKRVYKDELTPQQALTIIYQDVKDEKLNPLVYNALVNYVNSPYYNDTAYKTAAANIK